MLQKEYLLSIKGNNLENNIYSEEARKKAQFFVKKYPFIKKEATYYSFIKEINGVEIYRDESVLIFYGFAISEPELVYSPEKYIDARGYLLIGEYTDKRKYGKWRTIGYYFQQFDLSPIIYANFFSDIDEVQDQYYPLCNSFQELMEIALNKNFDEQFDMVDDS